MNRVFLSDYDPDILIWSLRAFYILAAYAIIIVRFIPDLRDRFLDYGARANFDSSKSTPPINDSVLPRWARIQFDPVLDWLADMTVPHSYFYHFYACSTICSALWIYIHRQAFGLYLGTSDRQHLTSWECRAILGMLLMQIQGIRRLYECLAVAKTSKSRMWIGHYLIGIAFYLVTNTAIWIEPAVLLQQKSRNPDGSELAWFNGARIVLCLVMFSYNSIQQYKVHRYLASLTTYQVPSHPIFEQTNHICPHYGFEINIYLTLAILTARDLRVFNSTMLCATFFVVLNLGVTADGTKKWMLKRFPQQRLEILQRRLMLFSIW